MKNEKSMVSENLNSKSLFFDGFVTLDDQWAWLQKVADQKFAELHPHHSANNGFFGKKYNGVYDLVAARVRSGLVKELNVERLERQVSELIGSRVNFNHCQLRFVEKSAKSYMPMHRDVSWYKGRLVGPLPVPYKLIVYPTGTAEADLLKLIPKSHRMMFRNKFFDLFCNFVLNGLKQPGFKDTNALLFDTSIIHHVPRKKTEQLTARLILTFAPAT